MKRRTIRYICAALILAAFAFPATVYADTNGSEIKITDQPDQLILQLGPEWAGVEFELKTDAGIFPAPVIVDSTGILKMDLGGSKVYTLSCIISPISIPNPETAVPSPNRQPSEDISPQEESAEPEPGIPAGILIFFLLGLAVAVGGLIAMRYLKNRRSARYYDEDDEDDYE